MKEKKPVSTTLNPPNFEEFEMNFLKTLFTCAALMFGMATCQPVAADEIEDIMVQDADRQATAAWIQESTNNKVTPSMAKRITNSVIYHAQRTGIEVKTILGIIMKESTFNAKAKSGYGAVGLMQVVPRYHKDKIAGRDITRIETNIEVGTTILKNCLDASGNKTRALACYSGQSTTKVTKYKQKVNAFGKDYLNFKREYLSMNPSDYSVRNS